MSRWWRLPGSWLFPGVAYDGTAGGLSTDGGTLVLHRYAPALPVGLDAVRGARHGALPAPPGVARLEPAQSTRSQISRCRAASPTTRSLRTARRSTCAITCPRRVMDRGGGPPLRFEIRALDTATDDPPGRPDRQRQRARRAAARRCRSPRRRARRRMPTRSMTAAVRGCRSSRRWTRSPGKPFRVDLPGLGDRHDLFTARAAARANRRAPPGDRSPARAASHGPSRRVMSLDVARIAANQPTAIASSAGTESAVTASLRVSVAGRSVEGRRIWLRQLGDTSIAGRLLVFGCIHGDECAARRARAPPQRLPRPRRGHLRRPRPQPGRLCSRAAASTARGVDLNRNFAAGWEPAGRRGDPEYPGPRAVLGARNPARGAAGTEDPPPGDDLVPPGLRPATVRPRLGPSRPAARRFAELARIAVPGDPLATGFRPELAEPPLPAHGVLRRRAAAPASGGRDSAPRPRGRLLRAASRRILRCSAEETMVGR